MKTIGRMHPYYIALEINHSSYVHCVRKKYNRGTKGKNNPLCISPSIHQWHTKSAAADPNGLRGREGGRIPTSQVNGGFADWHL